MINCHGLFSPYEVWFLEDNEIFKNRRLEIGICPFCGNKILGLFEKNKVSNKIVYSRFRDRKAKRVYQDLKPQIDYKKSDILKGSKSNMGFVYGKNEVLNAEGKTVIIQKSVDFNGTETIVKRRYL